MSKTEFATIKGHWLMGNLNQFNNSSLEFITELAQQGDAGMMTFGPFKLFLFNHPDYVREVLITKNDVMQKPDVNKQALKPISGDNLFTSDGDYWRTQHKLIQPAFHTKRIRDYAEIMVDYAQQMVSRWQHSDTWDMYQEMTDVTMNIVVKTLFDVDITTDTGDLSEAMSTIFHIADNRVKRVMQIPQWVPTEENRELKQALSIVKARLNNIITERRKTGEDKGDLLSMLLMAQDEDTGLGMTDLQVYHEVIALFAAGHETTANTLAWTLYLLSQNPEIKVKLRAEVDTVLGNRRATMDDLRQLPYTEMVIKESMRLYPVAWAISRQAIEPVQIGDYHIPRNAVVLVAPWVLHRDERWWDEPLQFRPERFSTENENNIVKYTYFPFGAGPRVCIGNAFAMMEAKLVLATIMQHIDFALDPEQVVEPERVFTLRPKHGLKMQITQREMTLHEPV